MLEQFRDDFIVRFDELRDPKIPCRRGFVYANSATALGVWLEARRPERVFNVLKTKLPGLQLAQLGDREFIALFQFSTREEAITALKVLGAHRRKRLTLAPEEIERRREQARRINAQRKAKQSGPEGGVA